MTNKNKYLFFPCMISIFFLNTSLLNAAMKSLPKNSFKISSFKSKGSGCPGNTVYTNISPDQEVITMIFDDFIVEKNGNNDPFGSQKNCNIEINLKKPKGWTFSMYSVDFEGVSDLEPRVAGSHKTEIILSGAKLLNNKDKVNIIGPYSNEYMRTINADLKKLRWESCEKKTSRINIKSEIAVRPHLEKKNSSSGFIAMNTSEGKIKQKLNLLWRPCFEEKRPQLDWLTLCEINIYKKPAKKLVKSFNIKARGKSEKSSLKNSRNKVKEFCKEYSDENPQRICKIKNSKCKSIRL